MVHWWDRTWKNREKRYSKSLINTGLVTAEDLQEWDDLLLRESRHLLTSDEEVRLFDLEAKILEAERVLAARVRVGASGGY